MGRLAESAALRPQTRLKSGGVDPSQKACRGDLRNCHILAPLGERAGKKMLKTKIYLDKLLKTIWNRKTYV
jgi:hypothetical protein